MTGGLLGMLSGTAWIPVEWKLIQDYNCLVNITEILLANNMIEVSKNITNQNKVQHNNWEVSPIGKIRVLSTKVVPSGKSGRVTIKKYETALGQTLYIKSFERKRIIDYSEKNQDIKTQPITNQQGINYAAFLVDNDNIQKLLEDSSIGRITFKKVLKIIDLLIRNNLSCIEVANKLNIDEKVVEAIKMQIRQEPEKYVKK